MAFVPVLCSLRLVFLVALATLGTSQDLNPRVHKEDLGTIIGWKLNSFYTSRPYSAFTGIPYAIPIDKDTRFQPSKPLPKFDEPFYATTYGSSCRQSVSGPEGHFAQHIRFKMGGGGDLVRDADSCLVLSVFTPKLPSPNTSKKQLLPVIVFVHGGGFTTGNMFIYDADRMMEEDVVMVTIQYRLGPTGFLCLQSPEIPGNAGLYDQTLALQWVNKHISAFGGDPTRVTINGQSAGSVSVSLLALSNYSNQYFQQVIAESGSALVPWGIDDDPKRHAMEFAQLLNCTGPDDSAIAKCLLSYSDDKLSEYFSKYTKIMRKNGESGFGGTSPCIQEYAPAGYPKILDKYPTEILSDPIRRERLKQLKFIFGSTETEGSYVMGVIYNQYLLPNNLIGNSTFLKTELGSTLLKTVGVKDPTNALAISVMEDYLIPGTSGDLSAMMPGLIDMMGVFFMKGGCYKTMELHAAISESYWYSFDYEGKNSQRFWTILEHGHFPPFPPGVTHGEELLYLYLPQLIFPLNTEETLLSRKMAKLWANFAIHGKPTPGVNNNELNLPDWKPYSANNPSFLHITSPSNFSIESNYPSLWHITRQKSIINSTTPAASITEIPSRTKRSFTKRITESLKSTVAESTQSSQKSFTRKENIEVTTSISYVGTNMSIFSIISFFILIRIQNWCVISHL